MPNPIPRKIPQPPPDYRDFFPVDFLQDPILAELSGVHFAESTAWKQGDKTTQELVNECMQEITDTDPEKTPGLETFIFSYEVRDYAPNGDVRMGLQETRYKIDMSNEIIQKYWQLILGIEIDLNWGETWEMEPLVVSVSNGNNFWSITPDDFTVSINPPETIQQEMIVDISINFIAPTWPTGEEQPLILSVFPGQFVSVEFVQITSQEDFDFFYGDGQPPIMGMTAKNPNVAPVSTPMIPAYQAGS